MNAQRSEGFTLIEISVVLVIIGLLAAGIVVGQSLIRASRVQTIIADVSTFQTALGQFKQKYGAVAGDMSNATGYWGVNPNCSTGGGGTGTQTCNGNGDGQITQGSSAPYEQFLVWQHLSDGGFIPGQYSGAAYSSVVTNANLYCYPGVNCPGGQVTQLQAYYLIYSVGGFGGNGTASYWDSPAGHYLAVGQTNVVNVGTNGIPGNALLTAPEAYMLDGKVDDGLPGRGLWKSLAANGTNCVIASATGLPPADGTIASESGAAYNVKYSNSTPACALLVQLNF